jgi:hypothetical protein
MKHHTRGRIRSRIRRRIRRISSIWSFLLKDLTLLAILAKTTSGDIILIEGNNYIRRKLLFVEDGAKWIANPMSSSW